MALFMVAFSLPIIIYYHNNKVYQQKLVAYNQALAEGKISQLKTQLNPHFLFNNLSVLTSLVYKNQDKAAQFINELAKVYFLFTIYFRFLMKLIFLQLLSLQFNKLKNIILVVCLQSVKSKKKSYSEE